MSSSKLLWLLPLLFFAACASRESEPAIARERITTESAAADVPKEDEVVQDSASRKIIHTADFRCTVPNVLNAATQLEMLVKSNGGFVEESNITNEQTQTKTVNYKPDSLLQATFYTSVAHLTLRIPVQQLDSVVYALPKLATHIESRTLKQDDVTLQYLSNKLKSEATVVKQAIQPRNTKEQISLQQYTDGRSEKEIDRKIANMGLLYEAEYATVTVALSQSEEALITHIVNPEYYTKVPVWLQLRDAFSGGLEACKALLLLLVSVWPLLLAAIAMLLVFKRRKKGMALW
jgi:hypothetical protein